MGGNIDIDPSMQVDLSNSNNRVRRSTKQRASAPHYCKQLK